MKRISAAPAIIGVLLLSWLMLTAQRTVPVTPRSTIHQDTIRTHVFKDTTGGGSTVITVGKLVDSSDVQSLISDSLSGLSVSADSASVADAIGHELDSLATLADAANTDTSAADSVHWHSNKDSLDLISLAGSGQIITDDERTKLSGIEDAADVTDSTNVATAIGHQLDSLATLADAGSGTDTSATDSVHWHTNKDTLDLVTQAGSGQIITDDERSKLAGIEASADVTDSTNVAAAIGHQLDSLATLADAGSGTDTSALDSVHWHSNKSDLDGLTAVSEGSNISITGTIWGASGASISATGSGSVGNADSLGGVPGDSFLTIVEIAAELQSAADTLLSRPAFADSMGGVDSTYITDDAIGFEDVAGLPEALDAKLATADTQYFSNKDTLDAISYAGSGQIITDVERTKLDGIEESADVTDSTNVGTAIGHQLDSLATLADVGGGSVGNADSLGGTPADSFMTILELDAAYAGLDILGDSTRDIVGSSGVDSLTINPDSVYYRDIGFSSFSIPLNLETGNSTDSVFFVPSWDTIPNQPGHLALNAWMPIIEARADTGGSGQVTGTIQYQHAMFEEPWGMPTGFSRLDSCAIFLSTSDGRDTTRFDASLWKWTNGGRSLVDSVLGRAWNVQVEATSYTTIVDFSGTFDGTQLSRYDKYVLQITCYSLNNNCYVRAAIRFYYGN